MQKITINVDLRAFYLTAANNADLAKSSNLQIVTVENIIVAST